MAEKVEAPTKKKIVKKTKQPVRLYAKGVILGYKRSKSNCYSNCTLLKIDGVRTKDDTQYYVGKKVAYVYKAKKEINHSKFRVMWGKIRRSHGNSGVVRAKFGKSIPPKAFGAACRVMLYPSSIWDHDSQPPFEPVEKQCSGCSATDVPVVESICTFKQQFSESWVSVLFLYYQDFFQTLY